MKSISLSQGFSALVDDCDFKDLSQLAWHYTKKGYAAHSVGNQKLLMHRFILERMGYTDFEETDHINLNKLDNRRKNLRPSTRSQNKANRKADKNKQSTTYKGVFRKRTKWMARITVRGRDFNLGVFPTPKEAAIAYNEAAIEHFGTFANLNKVTK